MGLAEARRAQQAAAAQQSQQARQAAAKQQVEEAQQQAAAQQASVSVDAAKQVCNIEQDAVQTKVGESPSSSVKRGTAEKALAVAREHLAMQKVQAAEKSKDDTVDKATAQEELDAETSLESETESTGTESETASEICAADLLREHRDHKAHDENNVEHSSAAKILDPTGYGQAGVLTTNATR